VLECPVDAIYEQKYLPEAQRHFSAFNAEMSTCWPLLPTPETSWNGGAN
jgi:hypothetical protein